MNNRGDDEQLLTEMGRIMDRRVESVDERISHLVEHVEERLSVLRRETGRLVLVCMWASTLITAGLCVATVLVALLIGN